MGPNYSISTASATSNYCFHVAANHNRRGEADLMIAGGTKATIIPIGVGGFVACRALSQRNDDPRTASRPWDKDRDGFVIGEGAGVLDRNPAQNAFDEALMKGRNTVEEAIGLLKGRWKILQDLNVGLNHAPQTIVACCVLHNLVLCVAREPEPELWKELEENGQSPKVLENEKSFHYYGESLRQAMADDLYQRLSSR